MTNKMKPAENSLRSCWGSRAFNFGTTTTHMNTYKHKHVRRGTFKDCVFKASAPPAAHLCVAPLSKVSISTCLERLFGPGSVTRLNSSNPLYGANYHKGQVEYVVPGWWVTTRSTRSSGDPLETFPLKCRVSKAKEHPRMQAASRQACQDSNCFHWLYDSRDYCLHKHYAARRRTRRRTKRAIKRYVTQWQAESGRQGC